MIASRFICGDLMLRTKRSAIYHGWDVRQDKPAVLKKAVDLDCPGRISELQREGYILKQNRTARLLQGEGYILCDGQHWLVMEPARGQLLLELMQSGHIYRLHDRQRRLLISSLIKAVNSLHDNGWVHGDLKPDNIFVDPVSMKVQLIDFSSSFKLGQESSGGCSHDWQHPSLKNAKNHQVDAYAVALLTWCLWKGKHPFEKNGTVSFFHSPEYWLVYKNWSNWLNGHWLRKMLKEPERLTLDELERRFG